MTETEGDDNVRREDAGPDVSASVGGPAPARGAGTPGGATVGAAADDTSPLEEVGGGGTGEAALGGGTGDVGGGGDTAGDFGGLRENDEPPAV